MNKMMVTAAAALVLASWGMWETWLRDPGNEFEDTTVVESVLATEERGQDDKAGEGESGSVAARQRQEVLTDSSPKAKADQLRLELSDAAGVPVPDLAYGIIENEFGKTLEGWSHEVMSRIQQNLLAQASRTTTEGLMILQDERKGMLLWVERKDELFEFYDLEKDPAEQVNLAFNPEHKLQIEKMSTMLDEWMTVQGDKQISGSGTPYPAVGPRPFEVNAKQNQSKNQKKK